MAQTNLLKKLRRQSVGTPLDQFVDTLSASIGNSGFGAKKRSLADMVISTEGISESKQHELSVALEDLETSMISAAVMTSTLSKDEKGNIIATEAQKEAAALGGLLAGNPRAFLSKPVVGSMGKSGVSGAVNNTVVDMDNVMLSGYFSERPSFVLEAYDETENRNAVVYSVAYNMQASRQNEFGEAFFPTITVAPDNVGYIISTRILQLVDGDMRRDISGSIDQYKERNVIRAQIDPSILENNLTQCVPVYRTETQAHFVPTADVGNRTVLVGRESVATSPLKVGARFSLLGISSNDALISNGLQDITDALEPAVSLTKLYVKVTAGGKNDVLEFDVRGNREVNFTNPTQGWARQMNLMFNTSTLLVNKNKKRVDGSDLDALAAIASNDVIVNLEALVTGTVDLEEATMEVHAPRLGVKSVQAADGSFLSLTSGLGATIAALFATSSIIGYDQLSYRTNSNRRQRGDVTRTRYYNQQYAVPLLPPISAIHPVTGDGSTDTSDLSNLITLTQIRASNNAVKVLLETADMMNQAIDPRNVGSMNGDLLGVGRHMVVPTFMRDTVDMVISTDSLTSAHRAADAQGALINKLRTMVYEMYVRSGFKAAADAYFGGGAPTPTVIIGTDQKLARYIQVDGDLRTIGPDFNVKIVSTVHQDMVGKIVVAFGYFDQQDGAPCPLHFGNMLWKPEIPVVVNIPRNGGYSKELTVMPSFLHTVNCPILGMLEVTNYDSVMTSKVNINMDIQ